MKNSIKISCLITVISLQLFTSCSDNVDSNEPLPYPPIGGYETSDDIAKSNDHAGATLIICPPKLNSTSAILMWLLSNLYSPVLEFTVSPERIVTGLSST